MTPRQIVTAAATILVVVAAVAYGVRQWRGGADAGELAWFYDVSKGQLFTAPRTAVPPIRGVDGPEEDGYLAVVISVTGRPEDKSSRRVAYLEKFAPELKARMVAAQAAGGSPELSRVEMQRQRFVRRLSDTEWFALDSPEAQRILAEWPTLGEGGAAPVLCIP